MTHCYTQIRNDTAAVKRVELSVHTKISEMDSVLSLREFIHTVSHWGWKTVAITDPASIQAFPEAMRLVEHRHQGIKIIYGMEGLQHLYELISLSHLQSHHDEPQIPKGLLEEHREGLIIGSAGVTGNLVQAITQRKSSEELAKIVCFF